MINPNSGGHGPLGFARFFEISLQRLQQLIRTHYFIFLLLDALRFRRRAA